MKLFFASGILTKTPRLAQPKSFNNLKQNYQPLRWSGHNTMEVVPSSYQWKKLKDMIHFYSMITFVPMAIVSMIIGIRGNPELAEIPEGYEPRHWEYEKHPVSRFMSRYIVEPIDKEHEVQMSVLNYLNEDALMIRLRSLARTSMRAYNDYQGPMYYIPFFAERARANRTTLDYRHRRMLEDSNETYEYPFKNTILPIEGYTHEGDLDKFD